MFSWLWETPLNIEASTVIYKPGRALPWPCGQHTHSLFINYALFINYTLFIKSVELWQQSAVNGYHSLAGG